MDTLPLSLKLEPEETHAQLRDRNLGRVDVEAADAEHTQEQLQEAGRRGGLIRQR